MSPFHRTPEISSGFAMVMALFLMAIIAILLLVMSAAFMRQVQSARGLQRRLQLQQLLTAGALDVLVHSRRWGTAASAAHWTVPLPSVLAAAGGAVRIAVAPVGASQLRATVRAAFEHAQARQVMTLRWFEKQWRVARLKR